MTGDATPSSDICIEDGRAACVRDTSTSWSYVKVLDHRRVCRWQAGHGLPILIVGTRDGGSYVIVKFGVRYYTCVEKGVCNVGGHGNA